MSSPIAHQQFYSNFNKLQILRQQKEASKKRKEREEGKVTEEEDD